MKIHVLVLLIVCFTLGYSQEKITLNSVKDAYQYADQHSDVLKTGNQQLLIAKWTKISAIGNAVNLRNPATFSMIDNVDLPVTFIPAEAFGGPAGSFKEITMGIQYVSNFNFTPTIDVINPSAIARIKSANANYELAQLNNQSVKKSLYESVSAAYENIVMLQAQKKLLLQNEKNMDTILQVVTNKYNAGIVRKTDENDALISMETVKEKANQLQWQIEQQYTILSVLLDIPEDKKIEINNQATATIPEEALLSTSDLLNRQYQYQYKYAKAEHLSAKLAHLPTLSFVSSFAWQQNSKSKFFNSADKWINSSYVGMKVTVGLPSDINKFAAQATAKYNEAIARYNLQHYQKSNDANNKQLILDYEKAQSQYKSYLRIQNLKEENYSKMLNLYKENLISIDRLMAAYNDKLANELLLANAAAIRQNSINKIFINNTVK